MVGDHHRNKHKVLCCGSRDKDGCWALVPAPGEPVSSRLSLQLGSWEWAVDNRCRSSWAA